MSSLAWPKSQHAKERSVDFEAEVKVQSMKSDPYKRKKKKKDTVQESICREETLKSDILRSLSKAHLMLIISQ